MPVHATPVSADDAVPPAQGPSAGGGGGAPPRPTAPRLRAVPSTRPGVADVPISPTGQERFYQVHDALLSLGARAMTNADDFERDLKKDQDELELQELGNVQNGDDSRNGSQLQVDIAVEALRSLPTSQASSQSHTSDADVARLLLGARAAPSVTEKPLPPSKAGQPAFHLYGLDEEDDSVQLYGEGAEDPDDQIENPDDASPPPPPPMTGAGCDGKEVQDEGPPDDDETEEDNDDDESQPVSTGESRSASQEMIAYLATANKPTARIKMRVPTIGSKLATAHDRMKSVTAPAEPSEIQQFLDFWQTHVSKINPPHVWYRQHTAPSSAATAPPHPVTYSCKLTLVMPNATKRTFETAASYSYQPAARMRAFLDARESGVLEAARKLREELGWQVEEQEAAEEREKVRSLKGGEKPWETLRAEQEKWMAPPINVRLDKDELNAVYGCTLTVQSSVSSPPLSFAVPIAFSTQREARAAAARLALEADIPEQFQRAFNDSIKRDRHGYIQVGDFTATEAAMVGETAQPEFERGDGEEAREEDGERKGGDDEARRDAVDTLHEHVKTAFGSRKQWVTWTYEHANQDTDKPTRGPPSLGATLTVKIPVTEKHPSAPPPFVVSTEKRYRTKYHARLACATTAFSNDLLSVLEPYRKEREEAKREKVERKAKQAEERRREREAGKSVETPRAGTVKYEDLETLQNPATYLNICAQQWTGNGSPLKFEYTTRSIEDSNIKLYGCTLTVFINISLSRTYEIPPSPEYKNRAAAKEAAIRLAPKERVLDLLTPAGFDPSAPPLTAAAASRLARAARGREPMDVDPQGGSGGAFQGAAIAAGPVDVPAARSPQAKDAVSRLDEFVQEWVGPGCLPQYDISRDERSGLYGGSLCIPFASGTAHEDFEDPTSKLVPNWSRTMNFAATSVSRAQAQQRFAQSALDDDIIQFMQENIPRRSEAAPPLEACECGVHGGSSTSPHKHERPESDEEGEEDASGYHEDATRDLGTLEPSPPPKKRAKLDLTAQGAKLDLTAQGESLVGKEGGSVERLRLGCRAILGTEAEVGPRYKTESHHNAFGASVTIPLDSNMSDWRTFGVSSSHTTRELASEAAASSALDAGILELIESRVRPKARPAPPVSRSNEDNKSRDDSKSVDKPGVTFGAQVPKHGEELAAARRALYGGFGAATQYQLQEIEKKLEAELQAEKEHEEARREEERKAEELKRMGNPLLPDVFATAETLLSLDKANSTTTTTTSGTTTTPQRASHVAALKAYCEQHQLAFPQFHTAPLSAEPSSSSLGEPRSRIWLFLRGLKFELPRVRASVAEERLAEKVVAHLKKLDDQAAATATAKEA